MAGDSDLDRAAIERVLGGDRESFRELVSRYRSRIYGLAMRLVGDPEDAADLTQQSFVEAYQGLGRFDVKRSFVTWLRSIAINNCKDYMKSHKRRERQLSGEVDPSRALFTGRVPGVEQQLVSMQRQRLLLQALERMDPKYRTPLILKDVEGLTYGEMEEILNLPLTTLKIRVVRARIKLQEQIKWLTMKN